MIRFDPLRTAPTTLSPLRHAASPAAGPRDQAAAGPVDRVNIAVGTTVRASALNLPAIGVPLGGTPLSLQVPALQWPTAAIREVEGHFQALGLSGDRHGLADVFASETDRAMADEPRVTDAQMARAAARADAAQKLEPVAQTNLFGFTRLIDAKFALDGRVIESLAQDLPPAELLEAVDRGPGQGAIAWTSPSTKTQLLASLVRQAALGNGASLQLNIDADLASWLEGGVKRSGAELQEAMGGAGAFCANLAAVQPNVTSHFYAGAPLPPRVAGRFGADVGVVSPDGTVHDTAGFVDHGQADRVNFSAEYTRDRAFTLYGAGEARINGEIRTLAPNGNGRIILGTPGTNDIGFSASSPETLRALGRGHDVFFMVGAHYLTKGSTLQSQAAALELARQLDVVKQANPRLLVHNQYVIPKTAANEAAVMGALRGHLDSISLNTVEVPGLLNRLHAAGLSEVAGAPSNERAVAERPATVLEGAAGLKNALGLRRVHLHGFDGDTVVADGVRDKERQVLALMRARQVASMKTSNASGEIRTHDDMWPVLPVVEGNGLAAVHAFADAMKDRFHLDDGARDRIVDRWYHEDNTTGETWFFVPSRGIHDRTGGTVSLGDTIDSTALMYGLER